MRPFFRIELSHSRSRSFGMRSLAPLLIAFLGYMYFVQPTQAQWRKTFSFPGGEDINTISFIDLPGPPRIGFANGNPLWRTTDGGQSWNKANIDSYADIVDVRSKDSLVGWASNDGGWPGTYCCYKTTNAGASWFPLASSGAGYASGIYYNDSNHTIFLGIGDSAARVSTDFGNTWNSIPLMNVSTFSFSSPSHGIAFAFAYFEFDVHQNTYWVDSICGMYVTSDGGSTWERSVQFNNIDTVSDDVIRQLFAVPNTSTCFAVSPGSWYAHPDSGTTDVVVFRSDDYGMTWRQVSDKHVGVGAGASVIRGTLDRLVTATDSGFFVSTDEGLTWDNHHGPRSVLDFYNDKGKTIAAGVIRGGDFGIWEEDWGTSGVNVLEPEQNALIYPNPTTSLIHLQSEQQEIKLFDALGREYLLRNEGGTVDLSSLTSGTYILRIETASGAVFRKVVRD